MNALQNAKFDVAQSEGDVDYNGSIAYATRASAYAAIATAEAMQLIAKRLEQFMETQGVGFEVIEAAERGIWLETENKRLQRRIAQLEGEPVESEYETE